ncbi:LOW QUALITY PROTEIN: alanine aminotransferase 2 [Xiphophorus hellerii]|uniref:LOW QUALITY PROTEIN: alanine aminotransferase 2 n=1 Tax=Xiphophorus hellerii TaxID=8084 RepID=UPI0013B3CB08|nr:LOW QUALITY PROTEIN: alanine aminotransferase 2-like [Xiphophorus hellerii]
MSVLQEFSSNVRNIKQMEYFVLFRRTNQIKEELRQGVRKSYREVIDVSWGDPHRAGVKPLSFVRQVLAACLYPQLMDGDKLMVDVKQRAQRLLKTCAGGSVGSYSDTAGIPQIIQSVSEYILRRDGGVPCHPENIYITSGSQWALTNILKVLVNSEASPRTGVLIPVPCHSTTIVSLTALGAVAVPYYLSEERGWALEVEKLQQALDSAKGVCNPVALYIINPGNPAGYVQSRKCIQEVIHFAAEKKLFLLADEVYQDCVYGKESEFVSYKRALAEIGAPLSDTVELASFHTASKGLMGECGLRTGYVELVNLDPAVMKYINNLFSTNSCPVLGQVALDVMVNPPQPGDPSYPLYLKETQHIRASLAENVRRVEEVINSFPSFSCQSLEGGAFAFPRVFLPPKAIAKAKEAGLQPDTFYCMRLLEEAGVLFSPGTEYGQMEGTYHIRFCIMTPTDTMEEILKRLSAFHKQFMREFA